MEQFGPGEIGADSDGMKYFLDAWGNPIHFLRWAPAYDSPLQPWDVLASPAVYPTQPDSFDPTHIYKPLSSSDKFWNSSLQPAQQFYPQLYPLIYSAGSTGADNISAGGASYHVSANNNDPYYSVSHSPAIGSLNGDGSGIISNHDIETR